MSNITNNYLKVREVINSLNIDSGSRCRSGRKPRMADIEVVALSLTAEFMSIDSENDLFRQVSSVQIPNLIKRSQFNKRRRKLFGFSETVRLAMASKFTELQDYFIVDSMPLEICKTARQNRIRICKENYETAPEKGFCASQNTWFYGYKLHGACTLSGVQEVLLEPGQSGIKKDKGGFIVGKADIEAITAWKNGYFVFHDKDIESIMTEVARWYKVEVEYRGDVKGKAFYGKISRSDGLSELLKNLELTGIVHFEIIPIDALGKERKVIVMP